MSSNVEESAGESPADSEQAVQEAYEAAKLQYIRSITAEAENTLKEAFNKRREAINEEIANMRLLSKSRQEAAQRAAHAYGVSFPKRVKRAGIKPPSFLEVILSFGKAVALYARANRASNELEEMNETLRKRRDRIEQLERETKRSIYLREESVRKRLQTPEGLAAMHADPHVRSAFAKLQELQNQHAAYAERMARGEVTPSEARDREMARLNMPWAVPPLQGVIIARVLRFGDLEYYVLRDLTHVESLLSADAALEPLRDVVFDATKSAAGYEASLRHNTAGVPLRAIDHIKATFLANDVPDIYKAHRQALKTERVLRKTPPHDQDEAELVAMLGLLGQALAERSQNAAAEAAQALAAGESSGITEPPPAPESSESLLPEPGTPTP